MPISNATVFWIEAGAMQGDSHNGLEIPPELAEFFGPDAFLDGSIFMNWAPGIVRERPFILRDKDDYAHKKDRVRLWLPTSRMGGPLYVGRVVRFEKLSAGGFLLFSLDVADVNSVDHVAWRQQSQASGQSGLTEGKREWGYW